MVDLSVVPDKEPANLSINDTTARDFRTLSQNANLTITPTANSSTNTGSSGGGVENSFGGSNIFYVSNR